MRWLLEHQFDSGQFLYYYDGATDTRRDHEHPERDPHTNPYYNLLRHGGAVLTLLFYEELLRQMASREAEPATKGSTITSETAVAHATGGQVGSLSQDVARVRRAIEVGCDFFVRQLVEYETAEGQPAAYAYFNRKAKLGGSGIGLYMLSLYQKLFDDRYASWARRLANHLAAQVQPSGEFRYYHIYLDELVTPERNRELFSFYYPGEAVIGLANYCRHVCGVESERAALHAKLHAALRFLLLDRPRLYRQHYQSLPADSWLMMGVSDLWDEPDFRDELYEQFVFADADLMIAHQYTPTDALYPDYVGSFYYQYGDHAYPDGARAEGLLAVYDLAFKTARLPPSPLSDPNRLHCYRAALDRLAWATLHLCNTADSIYSAANPAQAAGGIRFKLTRQWFRIDTIQHVASFYLKLRLTGFSADHEG